jgi:hypothetical protein
MEGLIISMIHMMKSTNLLLNKLIEDNDTKLVSLSQAGNMLNISKAKLRELINNNTIRYTIINNNPQRKSIRVNMTQVRNDLVKSGYFVFDESGYRKTETRGRKTKF